MLSVGLNLFMTFIQNLMKFTINVKFFNDF